MAAAIVDRDAGREAQNEQVRFAVTLASPDLFPAVSTAIAENLLRPLSVPYTIADVSW